MTMPAHIAAALANEPRPEQVARDIAISAREGFNKHLAEAFGVTEEVVAYIAARHRLDGSWT